tara:strand:+ start:12174 stop:12320 length:147 start_codon:yes stop_codon:yes gene_type:complete
MYPMAVTKTLISKIDVVLEEEERQGFITEQERNLVLEALRKAEQEAAD